MSMTINFYLNSQKNIVANKTPVTTGTATGEFKATVDVLRPTFVTEVASIPTGSNYAYIADFGRYYYITGMSMITNTLCELQLLCDVRTSFYTQLIANSGIVQRQANNYDMYLKDDKIPIAARKTISIRKFTAGGTPGYTPFGYNGAYIYMMVLGG